MIRQDANLLHPIVDGKPPLVLQYADDTLVILRACPGAAAQLRRILDDFDAATGLHINFTKSTLVPMHVSDEVLEETVGALGCAVQSFPQAYLGLPLSWEKLCFADFLPMIAKVDKYLAGWRARVLSPVGRLVLINVVLDALPTYAMAAMLLPPAVIKALDTLRRAFLWNAAERATGAQCLVAGERVCRAKEEGGFGVQDLETQNRCLLLKMLHRLHVASSSSRWAGWVWAELDGRSFLAPAACRGAGEHGRALRAMLPLYRSLSRVEVRDGRRTSFWFDSWLPCGAVAASFAALLSHTTDVEAMVWHVREHGLDLVLVPRLTTAGVAERVALLALVHGAPAASGDDERSLVLCSGAHGRLVTGAVYALERFGGVRVPFADFIWGAHAPSRVRFFGWLLVQRWIHTRDVLLRKTIVAADGVGCPICTCALETADHLVFRCPFARSFWQSVGVDVVSNDCHVGALHALDVGVAVGGASAATFTLLCCWQLWKHRNSVVFHAASPSLARLLNCC